SASCSDEELIEWARPGFAWPSPIAGGLEPFQGSKFDRVESARTAPPDGLQALQNSALRVGVRAGGGDDRDGQSDGGRSVRLVQWAGGAGGGLLLGRRAAGSDPGRPLPRPGARRARLAAWNRRRRLHGGLPARRPARDRSDRLLLVQLRARPGRDR